MITCSIEILALEKKKEKEIKFANEEFSDFQYQFNATSPIRSYSGSNRKKTPPRTIPFEIGPLRSLSVPLRIFVANSIHTGGATWPIVYYWPPSTGGEKKADTRILLEFLEADPAPARGNIFSLPLNVDVVCRWTSGSPNTEGQGRATPGGGRQQVTTGHTHARTHSSLFTGVESFSPHRANRYIDHV